MLPIRLELKNFLAYCTPDPIHFEGIHLACLSGPNGAGKSSILDAITWAIWGQARARSDDELIHLGCDEMAVTLDFWQANNRYRIVRQRKQGSPRKDGGRNPGTTTLNLLGWVEEQNTFRNISESSIRQTQQKIIDLVGLDFETFINSAYLQQGRADAFTMQTPSHRKKILTDILQLALWEGYEERTKERLREIDSELNGLETRLREIELEIAQEPLLRQEFEHAELQLEMARDQVTKAELLFREMAGADSELNAAETELRQINFQINERQHDIENTRTQIVRHQKRLAEYQGVIDQREAIEAGYTRLVEAREANQALGDTLRELREIEILINDLRHQILLAQQEIEREISSSESVVSESTRQSDIIDELREQIKETYSEIALLEKDEKRREITMQEIGKLREEEAGLNAANKALRPEMDEIKNRLDLVKATSGATCPLCGQPLTEKHRHQLAKDLQQEGTIRGDQFRANRQRIEGIEQEIKEHEQSIRILEKRLPQLASLRGQLGSLNQQLFDAENARRKREEFLAHVEFLRDKITRRDFAHELQAQFAEAEQRRDSLGYDPNAHDAIRETLETYKAYQDQSTALDFALKSLPDAENDLSNAIAQLERWQTAQANLAKRAEEIALSLVDLRAKVTEMQRREQEWNYQRTLERQALEKRTALKQQLLAIEEMRRRSHELQRIQAQLQEEQGVFQQLRLAFGKNGIPAMIIEAAIPELENATNHLLARMTEGRLAVRFETQREKKTGGVAETFDIWISDELGTRDYTLYSGGEAFRVNFAIRIAVSQLLARRAGAKLRTLFMDEGFGTQDDVGRERLVEAITTIQDDFDLILVITHIDELRDAFPVRIEVEKFPDGSRIKMT